MSKPPDVAPPSQTPPRIWGTWRDIVHALRWERDAVLAEQVGLSPSPCSRRIKALEESGLILKHVTLLNPEKLNLKLTAYIHINMDKHTPERLNNFNKAIS